MDHGKDAASSLRKQWSVWLLRIGIMAMAIFGVVANGDQNVVPLPPSGLLCISDCATCPVICSPPPPPFSEYKPPPHHSPAPSYHTHSPPRPPPPPSPPFYFSWGAPPPPFHYISIPSLPVPPAKGGQPDYGYPYYYFYASDSFYLSFSAFFLFMAFSLNAIFLCW